MLKSLIVFLAALCYRVFSVVMARFVKPVISFHNVKQSLRVFVKKDFKRLSIFRNHLTLAEIPDLLMPLRRYILLL